MSYIDTNNQTKISSPISFLEGINMEKLMNGYYTPTTNIKETDEYLLIEIELPGVIPSEIHMEYGDGMLDVRGEHIETTIYRNQTIRFIRKERIYGKFKKSIQIGENINNSQIKASYRDGILLIEIPKIQNQQLTQKQKIKLL